MSEPYLGLLIGAAPDLPPLFESQSDDLEWMVVQTSSLTVALNRRTTWLSPNTGRLPDRQANWWLPSAKPSPA
jgi:hypothetical protein